MSYHIASIDSDTSSISVAKGMLISTSPEGSHSIPMEDVASIIITSFKCTLTSNFLIEAAKKRIGVILCELYRPVCIVLPIDRATDTELFFLKKENMHDILNDHDEEWAETGVQPDEGWIHFAEMSDEEPDAWCSSHDLDMYVREITTELDRIEYGKIRTPNT